MDTAYISAISALADSAAGGLMALLASRKSRSSTQKRWQAERWSRSDM